MLRPGKWRALQSLKRIEDPARLQLVQSKLVQGLQDLIEDIDSAAEREEIRLSASEADVRAMETQVAHLRQGREESLKAVNRSIQRLNMQLPGTVTRAAADLRIKMGNDIDQSGKWLGWDDCAQWVTAHALPFGVRGAARSVEEQVAQELDRLDRELEEIANTAVNQVQEQACVKSDAPQRLGKNLTRLVLQRVGGSAFQSFLRGLGGVGGAAAGAGNLVKMLVTRAGKLLGKKFSREVYNQIGRTFTKRALQRLNTVVSVLIEAGIYLVHVHSWQGELKKQVNEAVEEWAREVIDDLRQNQIPAIERANVDGVRSIYDDLIQPTTSDCARSTEAVDASLAAIRSRRALLHSLLASLA